MRPASPTPQVRAHLPTLDGLRGLAIVTVLAHHFVRLPPSGEGLVTTVVARAAHVGWVGVDLFFVLSGFLITGILADTRDQQGYFRVFYARRSLRIFPLYYAFLLLGFVVLPSFTGEPLAPPRTWPWFTAYGTNVLIAARSFSAVGDMGHLWSLAVEEQFYVVWPLLVYLLGPRTAERVSLALVGAGLVLRLWLATRADSAAAMYVLLPTRVDALAVGAWLAFRLRRPIATSALRPRAVTVGVIASAAFVCLAFIAGGDLRFSHPAFAAVAYTTLALASGALLVLALIAPAGSVLHRVLTAPTLLAFGRYSYGLYVLHSLAPRILHAVGLDAGTLPRIGGSPLPGALAWALVATGVAWSMAHVSWRVLESPVLGLKRHFPYTPRVAPSVPSPEPQPVPLTLGVEPAV